MERITRNRKKTSDHDYGIVLSIPTVGRHFTFSGTFPDLRDSAADF